MGKIILFSVTDVTLCHIGIVDPIKATNTVNRVGLGVNDEIDKMADETTKCRKKLDVEIEQSQESISKKNENAERLEQIESNIKDMNKEFYCEICDKQYKTVSEVCM